MDETGAVWAAPKQDVWVIRTMVDPSIGAGPRTHALRCDGTQWNGVSTNTDVNLLAVWGAADDDVRRHRHLKTKDGELVKLLAGLPEAEQALFIEQAIETRLHIDDVEVAGELPRLA